MNPFLGWLQMLFPIALPTLGGIALCLATYAVLQTIV